MPWTCVTTIPQALASRPKNRARFGADERNRTAVSALARQCNSHYTTPANLPLIIYYIRKTPIGNFFLSLEKASQVASCQPALVTSLSIPSYQVPTGRLIKNGASPALTILTFPKKLYFSLVFRQIPNIVLSLKLSCGPPKRRFDSPASLP